MQERSRATTAALLEAAARVFASEGYARGTTNRIAERAGVSVGSLYEYFPSKDALLVALVEEHIRDSSERLAAAIRAAERERPSLPELVRRFVDLMVELHGTDPALHRVLFEEAPLPPRVRRALASAENVMAEGVEQLLRATPGVDVADPALAARLVVQVVEGLTHRLVLYAGDRPDLERVGDEVVRLVTRYLGSSEGAPPPRRRRGKATPSPRLIASEGAPPPRRRRGKATPSQLPLAPRSAARFARGA